VSEPKRYERCYHKDYIPEGMEEHYNGKWVKWEDYARLKADIERLTKAGDLMCRMAGNNQVINRHWKTAKKGVQS